MTVKNKKKDMEEDYLDEESGEVYGSVYTPSEAVVSAKDYLSEVRDSGYNRKWAKALDSLVDAYMFRDSFSYDPESDIRVKQMRSNTMRSAALAMEDAEARAAVLSGGYGNSYAASVGSAAYSRAVESIMDKEAEYLAEAYERYKSEGSDTERKIAMLSEFDSAEYERYADALSRADAAYADEYERDYEAWRDSVADGRYASEREYEIWRDSVADDRYEAEREYEIQRDRVADERYTAEQEYNAQRDSIEDERYAAEQSYKAWRDSIEDERYAAERDYTAHRDDIEDGKDAAKLAEDARQFDEKLSYDELKTAYDELLSKVQEADKAEAERTEREDELAELKLTPTYRNAVERLKYSSDKAETLMLMYDNKDFGDGEKALDYVRLLCADYGLSLGQVLK